MHDETRHPTDGNLLVDDPRLLELVDPHASVRKLAGGFAFLEGPAWVGDRLVFSDIPQDTLHVWSPDRGVDVYRKPSFHANGNTVDPDGHLYTAEHASRALSVTEPAAGGKRRVLADSWEKGRFHSPNDLVVAPDGAVWFTDPPYGLPAPRRHELMDYQGHFVFRLVPGQTARPVATDFDMPNGLCFSPDATHLYVADSGKPRHVRRFSVRGDRLDGGDVFCNIDQGVPDGMRTDVRGNLYSTAGDGIHVFDPEGRRLGKILVPESPANCTFGGEGDRTLYITARTGLYAVDLRVPGARISVPGARISVPGTRISVPGARISAPADR